MEIFPPFAVGFRWNDQDASRARIFSWSASPNHHISLLQPVMVCAAHSPCPPQGDTVTVDDGCGVFGGGSVALVKIVFFTFRKNTNITSSQP